MGGDEIEAPRQMDRGPRENFVATTHERGQIHDAEIAFDKDGHVLGVHDVFLHGPGAYAPYGLTVPLNSQCTLLGPYDIQNYYSEFTAVFTNKTIVTPYRGTGRRRHCVFVLNAHWILPQKN